MFALLSEGGKEPFSTGNPSAKPEVKFSRKRLYPLAGIGLLGFICFLSIHLLWKYY